MSISPAATTSTPSPQFKRTRCRHLLTHAQPCMHDDVIARHRSTLDLTQMRTGFAFYVRTDHEHLIAAWSLRNAFTGMATALCGAPTRTLIRTAAPGAGMGRRVVDPGAHHRIPRRGIDTASMRRSWFEPEPPHRPDRHPPGRRAATRPAMLRYRKVTCTAFNPLRVVSGVLIEVLPRTEHRQADPGAERSTDSLTGDQRFRAGVCACNIEIRPGAIDLLPSRGKILGQGSASIENRTRQTA